MRVLVLGGDGFCGWPTALHLSARGHHVGIVDNLSRRRIDQELGVQSLTPIATLSQRVAAWKEVSGQALEHFDLTLGENFDALVELFQAWKPDAVVHFAEQRAAPYSMKSARHKRYTVSNNINATHDVLAAIVESGRDIHLAHPRHHGRLRVWHSRRADPRRLSEGDARHPGRAGDARNPVSVGSGVNLSYDQDPGSAAVPVLRQERSAADHRSAPGASSGAPKPKRRDANPRLVNRFDYDGDYGTVLNRFLMQAALGYPLTVHGTGGQTRAFINVQDTVRCIELALLNPPARGERVAILNQMVETRQVRELAETVARLTGGQDRPTFQTPGRRRSRTS